MICLALVGFGRWGKNYIKAAEETGLAKVTTLVLRKDSEKWQDTAINSFKCTSDLDDLDSLGVDAAIVALHPSQHALVCCELLHRKIPTMVEKPLALGLIDALQIKAAVAKAGVPFMVNHQHLATYAYLEIIRRTEDEEITEIVTQAGNYGPFRDYSALWDYGPHDLSMILELMRSSPQGVVSNHQPQNLGERYAFELAFKGGVKSKSVIWNDSLPKARSLEVKTKTNRYLYDDLNSESKLIINGELATVMYKSPLTLSIEKFIKLIKTEKDLNTPNSRNQLQFMDAELKIVKLLEEIHSLSKKNKIHEYT
jgi:predicted dehydrogenase